MYVALLLALNPPTVGLFFDKALQTHSHMISGSVSVRATSSLPGKKVDNRYRLQFIQPDRYRLEKIEPPKNGGPELARTYYVLGSKFYGHDPAANEYLTRDVSRDEPFSVQFASVVGGLEDAVLYVVEPQALEKFLSDFRKLRGWNVAPKGSEWQLRRSVKVGKRDTFVDIRLSQGSMRINRVAIQTVLGNMNLEYKYSAAPRTIQFRPPQHAMLVDSFYQRPDPPKFLDKQSKSVTEKALRAYNKLHALSAAIVEPEGETKIWWNGRKMREQGRVVDWAYDGKVLYVSDKRNEVYYEGAVPEIQVNSYLAQLGARVDPMLRSLSRRRNPIYVVYKSDLALKTVGQVSIDGVTTDIVEAKAPGVRIMAQIRRDGLLANVVSENRDQKGNPVSQSERTFRYSAINQPIADKTFKLNRPSGFEFRPISALLKVAASQTPVASEAG